MTIEKSGPDTARLGDLVTYSIVVTNVGPSDAAGVVVTDPAPTGLAFVSAGVPTPTPPPRSNETRPPRSNDATIETGQSGDGVLAVTGSNLGRPVIAALAALVSGTALVLAARRRTRT